MIHHIVMTTSAGSFNIGGAPPVPESSCALSGTFTQSADQDGMVTGGYVCDMTLTADDWEPTAGDDNAITTAIIDGMVSAQNETNGYNNQTLTHAAFTRVSDSLLRFTLPVWATYATTANEVLTITLPASALQYTTSTLVVDSTVTIATVEETVTLTGTMTTDSPTEDDIVTGGKTLIFTVSGDQWVATLGADNAITTAFLAAIDSAQSEATGWDAEVRDNLDYTMLTRDSAQQCTLVLPAAASYDITASETITATPPASSLLASSSAITASPTIIINTASYFTDSFVSGDFTATQNGFAWGLPDSNGSGDNPVISTDVARTGSNSVKFHYYASAQNAMSELPFTFGSNLTECWIEMYLWFPSNYVHQLSGGVNNNKLLSMWTGEDRTWYNGPIAVLWQLLRSGENDGSSGLDWYSTDCPDVFEQQGYDNAKVVDVGTPGNLEEWLRFRFHVKVASHGGSDGVMEMWRGADKYTDESALAMYHCSNSGLRYISGGYVLGYHNSGYPSATDIYIDDFTVYIDDPGW